MRSASISSQLRTKPMWNTIMKKLLQLISLLLLHGPHGREARAEKNPTIFIIHHKSFQSLHKFVEPLIFLCQGPQDWQRYLKKISCICRCRMSCLMHYWINKRMDRQSKLWLFCLIENVDIFFRIISTTRIQVRVFSSVAVKKNGNYLV